MNNTIIKAIRDFIKTYPYLREGTDGKLQLGIDYLKDDTTSYSIEEVPINPVFKKYIDGSSIRQSAFILCSRELYGPDIQHQLSNSGFFEDFSNWLEKCTKEGNLPVLTDGEAISIEAVTSGYAFSTESDNAQYQIQIIFKYLKEIRSEN